MPDFTLQFDCIHFAMPRPVYTPISDRAKQYAAVNDLSQVPGECMNEVNRVLVGNGFTVTMDGVEIKP